MRHEGVHRFKSSVRDPHVRADTEVALPPELAFLRPGLVEPEVLFATAQDARRLNVEPARVLIATGRLAASTYYRELARHLGLPFVDGWPGTALSTDIGTAHRLGLVEMADRSTARWLIAPEGRTLHRLVSESRLKQRRSKWAITTPAHLSSIIHFENQQTIEQIATEALPSETPRLSAKNAVDKQGLLLTFACLSAAWICEPRLVNIALGAVFLIAITFRIGLYVSGLETLSEPPRRLSDHELPVYTVLVALHDEAAVLPDLLEALEDLDYPRAKLDVLLLIEPEDSSTQEALAKATLPPWIHIVFGPFDNRLRTKPRALNIGLLMARGELLTIFDAEDRPQPSQLRVAAALFADAPDKLACLQAQLSIDNGQRSLLARLFAIEYAALFDILNIGISNLRLPMALGGTSSHFRTNVLREVGAWDAWNVTEDADLGLRLARFGYDVVSFPSTTSEAAPEKLESWFKQRRRWTKGWMQTLVVLLRDGPSVARQMGWGRTMALCLLLVNLVIGPLLFPPFTAYALYRFARYGVASPVGVIPIVEATLEVAVIMLGIASTVGGGYLGMHARRLRCWTSLPLLIPYQLLISAAACMGLWDLFWRPHHWHKTAHEAREDVRED